MSALPPDGSRNVSFQAQIVVAHAVLLEHHETLAVEANRVLHAMQRRAQGGDGDLQDITHPPESPTGYPCCAVRCPAPRGSSARRLWLCSSSSWAWYRSTRPVESTGFDAEETVNHEGQILSLHAHDQLVVGRPVEMLAIAVDVGQHAAVPMQ